MNLKYLKVQTIICFFLVGIILFTKAAQIHLLFSWVAGTYLELVLVVCDVDFLQFKKAAKDCFCLLCAPLFHES